MLKRLNSVRWKNVPGYDGLYIISELGNIFNTKTGKFLTIKRASSNKSARVVQLCKNGIPTHLSINKLTETVWQK